jgi:F0F1-type ATP synthase membrane subunit b/b'
MELNPLNQIDPIVILSVMTVFAITYVLLRRTFILPYLEVMEARAARLDHADEMTREAQGLLEEAEGQAGPMLTQAREKADRILREARDAADSERRGIAEETTAEVARWLESGRAQLSEERRHELDLLRTEAVTCVSAACTRLVGHTDGDRAEAAVERVLARRLH